MFCFAFFVFAGATFLPSQGAVVYPRASQIEPCSKPLDLMIVLDSSGSVSDVWNNTIDYTEKLLSNFNIADDQVRVGLIEFSMVANALLPLDSGNSLGRLNQILEEARISPQNGETHTDKALYLAASIFRASPRTYTVPRVLVVITDGEITSGDFSDLDKSIVDLSSLLVETYVVAQGDDIVEEGLLKIANTKDFNHLYSLTPVRKSVPDTTQSLASAICNSTVASAPSRNSASNSVQVMQSTTTIQNRIKQESQQQAVKTPTISQWQQQQPIPQPSKTSSEYQNAGQSAYQEGAWHQNLQQSVGKPKQVYPESTVPQPLPSMPVENPYESVADKAESSGPNKERKVQSCNLNVTKVGCYRDLGQVPRALPIRLMGEKDNNFHFGLKSSKFDKEAWQSYLPDFICRCANKARENHFWTFGIQDYNECFSGPDEGRFDEDGDAEPTKCLDDSLNTCSKTSQYCSGTDHTNYVYTVITSGHKGIIRIEYA